MEAILPTGHGKSEKKPETAREALVAAYKNVRGALHTESSWKSSEDCTLTYAQTGAGFTSRQGLVDFCSANPAGGPIDAAYIARFNNSCDTLSLVVDVEAGAVHETVLVRTLFDVARWSAFLLPDTLVCVEQATPLAPVTFVMSVNAVLKDSLLTSCIVQWDMQALLSQLKVNLRQDAVMMLPRIHSRLSHPNRSNAIYYPQFSASPSKGKDKLSMAELLTDLPVPRTPSNNPSASNPAMASRPDRLFVTEEMGREQAAAILQASPTTRRRAQPPGVKSSIVLTDGTDEAAKTVASPTGSPKRQFVNGAFEDEVPVQSVQQKTAKAPLSQFTSQISFDYN